MLIISGPESNIVAIRFGCKIQNLGAYALRNLDALGFAKVAMQPHRCVKIQLEADHLIGKRSIVIPITNAIFKVCEQVIQPLCQNTRCALTELAWRLHLFLRNMGVSGSYLGTMTTRMKFLL
jgi:hypothetical protein